MDKREKSPSGSDKRKSRRMSVGYDLLYRVGEPAQLRVEMGEYRKKKCTRMLDISESGMAISTDTPLAVGTELEITFHVIFSDHQTPPMETRGYVRYCAPAPMAGKKYFRLGIEFAALSEQDRATIANFIKARAPIKK